MVSRAYMYDISNIFKNIFLGGGGFLLLLVNRTFFKTAFKSLSKTLSVIIDIIT